MNILHLKVKVKLHSEHFRVRLLTRVPGPVRAISGFRLTRELAKKNGIFTLILRQFDPFLGHFDADPGS